MRRTLAALVLIVLPGAVLAAPGKEARCDQFGQMSAELAKYRLDGKSDMDAMLAVAETYKSEPPEILQVIPFLSSYVYGLTETQLSGDVATPMAEQCKAG